MEAPVLFASILFAAEVAGTSVEGAAVRTLISAGPVGVFLLMVLFRWKIQPTYVYDDAKKEWERERARLEHDLVESKATNVEAQRVYVDQVIPTLTRVLDVLRKAEDRSSRG